ncbi:phosphate:Na+ symporter [Cribrihabitans marinus]|uniref:Phosphate:Na+ symporter n=1 Tax=Cribrihabitans marinus TaxID=1227549 RepID=A0A1H7D0X4_9RHOB|nr:Na/Pi cotransporter family protein [Cribrihabitans marinus]GGH37200.1 Na+/cotransporter [Cribrihabitans marinus]SEJ95064.1 phosphate:Na+ symporter [Cribrihabitans marinus]
MAILTFIVHLAGATMLLLFAVRMVRTGIERALGPAFRTLVTTPRGPVPAAAMGMVLAIVLQSSAAVALLVAGFAGAGGLAFATGLAVILGADLGSALLIQVLSLNLQEVIPVLLAVGGVMFLRSERRNLRQAGRIILGIAFILIALEFLRETMEPIRDSQVLPAVAAYLERDYVTAFLAGAALAFIMHSSVAAILMCVTVVATGALPVAAGLSLLLGANLGSALIPVWLSRAMEPSARRLPATNLALRGAWAIVALLLVNRLPVLDTLPAMPPGQALVVVHVLFNAVLLVVALPFCALVERPALTLFPDLPVPPESEVPLHYRSSLDPTALSRPAIALAGLRREVLRMEQVVEEMMTPAMELFSEFDRARMKAIRAKDSIVNEALDGVRRYAAGLPSDKMRKSDEKELRELLEYAIALEAAGDIVVKSLLPLAAEKAEKGLRFSKEGQRELQALHDRVLQNMRLAAQVLVSNDPESARLLLTEKDEMRRLHRASRKKHLQRLSAGEQVSFQSSDVHLETAHALKEFNSQITAVAYPILFREGQLLDTRLIANMDDELAD